MFRIPALLALACLLATPLTTQAQEQPAPADPFAAPADELAPPPAPDGAAPAVDPAPGATPAAGPGPGAAAATGPAPAPQAPMAPPPGYGAQVVVVQGQPYEQQPYAQQTNLQPQPYGQPVMPQRPPPPPHDGGGVGAEIGLGLVGAGAGIGLTFAMLHGSTDLGDAFFAFVFGPIASFWFTDLGIYLGGRITGGQSSFGFTLIGTAAGAGIGTLIGFRGIVWNNESKAAIWGATALSFACAIAGGTVFFEWGDRRARRRDGYALTPYVAPTRGGATFGFGAAF
ncbi:MAG: hypothetical protein GW913_13730 [Myxococcales bacterium]|nr:hypothetical protein [Myxococcales bacterium]